MNRNKVKHFCWSVVYFVYEAVKPFAPLRILSLVLLKYRFVAYRKYAKIKLIFGADCAICSCAYLGTGDYYFSGMYLKSWLEKNCITNYVFNAPTPQHLRILKLFEYITPHTYNIGDNLHLNGLKFFLGSYPIDYHYFFYVGGGASNRGFFEMYPDPSYLLGYKGFSILDCYLRLGFNLPRNTIPIPAKFSNDVTALYEIISSVNAVRGKTILISPYAVSYDGLPPWFWNRIVHLLKQRGYSILTNVGKNEKLLRGTIPLLLQYELSVPFLDFAGGFIGIRSGLCDIISSSICKKVIIHPYHAINWPDGTSLGFCGLKNMGLCDDAVELALSEYNANKHEIIQAILEEFP